MSIYTPENSEGLRIALDIEGTLVDIDTPFFKDFDREHGTNYSSISTRGWHLTNIEPEITPEEFVEKTKHIWLDKPERMKPIEKNFDRYIKQIDDRHTIDIVTERQGCDDKLKDWLVEHDLKEGRDYRIFIATKDKSQLKFYYNLYVDDKPVLDVENLIIFDKSYNRDRNAPIRIDSLRELPIMFNNYENEVRKLMNHNI